MNDWQELVGQEITRSFKSIARGLYTVGAERRRAVLLLESRGGKKEKIEKQDGHNFPASLSSTGAHDF